MTAANGPDVLIIGAGPVGLTMALELVRQGVRCRIVDEAATPTDKSKALVIWGRTLELLDRSEGLVGDLVSRGVHAKAGNIFGNGKPLVRVEFKRDDTAYPQPLLLPQCDTERILTEHLARRGVTVERSVTLVDFVDDQDRVLSRLRLPEGREEIVQSAWLVGCDGAHSTVRKRLGLEFTGEFDPNDWMLADVHIDGPVPPDELGIYWHSAGIAAFFPIGQGRFRVIADLGPATSEAKPHDPALWEVQAALDQRGLEHVRLRDPLWLAGFRIHERKVSAYGHGHVFLAGDAAHIHSPAGGQGMNTGMQDACNLAWKLSLVLPGQAAASLLESYSLERSAVGELVLRNASRMTQVATLRNPFLQFVRNHVAQLAGKLSAVQQRFVADLMELSIHYPDSPLNGDDPGKAWGDHCQPGDRLPDADVTQLTSGTPTHLLATLGGSGHWLLALPDRNEPELLVELAQQSKLLCGAFGASLRSRLIVPAGASASEDLAAESGCAATLVDAQGQVRERLGVHGTALVLVRPDGYIGFRGHAESWLKLAQHLESYLLPATAR